MSCTEFAPQCDLCQHMACIVLSLLLECHMTAAELTQGQLQELI